MAGSPAWTIDRRHRFDSDPFGSLLAYAGSFAVVDGVVTLELEICLFPNWVGTRQVRYASFDGDHLVLRTTPLPTAGRSLRSELAWTRTPETA